VAIPKIVHSGFFPQDRPHTKPQSIHFDIEARYDLDGSCLENLVADTILHVYLIEADIAAHSPWRALPFYLLGTCGPERTRHAA